MSSKGTRQTITIISIIHGAVSILIKENHFSRCDIKENLESYYSLIADVRDEYAPEYNGTTDVKWTLTRIHKWDSSLQALGIKDSLHRPVLVQTGVAAALNDLLEKVRDKRKRKLLLKLQPFLLELSKFVDPDGGLWSSFEMADKVLFSLYLIIDFEV